MKNKAIIKHIEFWTSSLKRSTKFYRNIFRIIGWEHREHNAFSNGETKIYFIEQDVKPRKAVGPRHMCFLANSKKTVNEVADFLVRTKADVIRGPLESKYKGKSSYTVDFRDPDGYVIEVATESISI